MAQTRSALCGFLAPGASNRDITVMSHQGWRENQNISVQQQTNWFVYTFISIKLIHLQPIVNALLCDNQPGDQQSDKPGIL